LDIGLPVEQLKAPVRETLAGNQDTQEIVIPAVTRRGRTIQCKVTCLPLGTRPDGEVTGVIMMMEPVDETRVPA
jgi:two-component system CheB/CheR fusion protein